MTTFDFAPSSSAPFQFQPTLDGEVYSCIVTWNLFGRRYYLNLYSLAGVLVVSKALVGSPTGVFMQSSSWAHGEVTVTTAAPHGHQVGTIVNLTISGAAPDALDGLWQCQITGPSEFKFSLASDPGSATTLGRVDYNIDLVLGYFSTSTLVFRQANQQFEVTP